MQYNKDNFSNNRTDVGSNNKVNLRSDTSWLGQVLKPVVLFGLVLISLALIYIGIAFSWILEAMSVIGVIWLFVFGLFFLTIKGFSHNAENIGQAIGAFLYGLGQARRNRVLSETQNGFVLDEDDGMQVYSIPAKEVLKFDKPSEEAHSEIDPNVLRDLNENHGVSENALAYAHGVTRHVIRQKLGKTK